MKKETTTVIVLSVIVFLVLLGLTILTPALPFYAEELGADEFMVGLLISGYALARVLLDLPAGVLGDRKGQKRIMGYGLILIATSSTVAGFAFSYWVLLAVRVAEGVGSALYVTSSVALLAKVVPPSKRGQYMSYYVSALLLGGISGPAVGGYVARYLGLNWPFFFYAIAATVALILMVRFLPSELPEKADDNVTVMADVGRLIRNPSFLLVNLATLSAFFVRGGINGVIFPLWSAGKFGFDTSVIGLLLTVAAIASMGTMFPSGHLADRYGRKMPFMASLLLTAAVLPFIFYSDTLASLTVMMALYGLAIGMHGPMAAWAADLAPSGSMGTAMGVYRTVGDLGWVLGPLVLSLVARATGPIASNVWPFLVASIWLTSFGLLLIFAKDPVARRGRATPLVADGKG